MHVYGNKEIIRPKTPIEQSLHVDRTLNFIDKRTFDKNVLCRQYLLYPVVKVV